MKKMRMFLWMLMFAGATVVISDGMSRNNIVAMAEEADYYDAELVNIAKSYNMGVNAGMTGGTAGTIYPGEKFRIIRKDTSNNKYGYCYYVYAINAEIYGYVSPSYIKLNDESKKDTDKIKNNTEQRYDAELVNVSKSYNLGLNANMTGGTAGTVYPREKFQVIRKDTSNNKYGYCYYVYAINAGLYGYISPTYIELLTEKVEYIPFDLANHIISVTSANGDTSNTLEKHNWVSNECDICGCIRTEKTTYSKTNDIYHKVSIEYTYPIDGGKTTKSTTQEHIFENGKCVKCGRTQVSKEEGLYVTLNKATVYKGTNSLTGRVKTLKKGVEVYIEQVITNKYNNVWGKLSDGSGYVWMANLKKKGNYVEDIVAFAEEQWQEFRQKYVIEKQSGFSWKKLSGRNTGPWCADFILWCAQNAGVPQEIIAWTGKENCNDLVTDIVSKGGNYHTADGTGYVPKVGDIICYASSESNAKEGKFNHVGLVVSVDETIKKCCTIEGNTVVSGYTGDDKGRLGIEKKENGKARSYAVKYCKIDTSTYIAGFASPNYGSADTTISSNENNIKLDVELHIQETNKTCGVACVKMILDFLNVKSSSGKSIPESTLWSWANSYGEGDFVYRVSQTLTYYGVPYRYVSMENADDKEYWDVLQKSLLKNRPVIALINTTKNSYWKYSSGHYIVITGVDINDKGEKQVIINDCHYQYGEKGKVVPLEELIRVNKLHTSYVIVAE